MMGWFGPGAVPPFDPDDLEHVPTPVGQACAYCDEPVLANEYGFTIPHTDRNPDNSYTVTLRPWHNECPLADPLRFD